MVRITSTAIQGSDLHLYEVLGSHLEVGDILGREPMGVDEDVAVEVTEIRPGERVVVVPFPRRRGAVSRRVLVAGVGNIFLGDDGFGVEVARQLAGEQLPEGVEVADFGIRGVHLAYQLLEGYDLAILVDASPFGGEPGSVYVIEPTLGDRGSGEPRERSGSPPDDGRVLLDGHGMQPDAVLGLLRTLGGRVGRVLVVGCEPAEVRERIGLSEPVGRAVGEAVRVVRELVTEAQASMTPRRGEDEGGPPRAGRPGPAGP